MRTCLGIVCTTHKNEICKRLKYVKGLQVLLNGNEQGAREENGNEQVAREEDRIKQILIYFYIDFYIQIIGVKERGREQKTQIENYGD